MRREGLDASVGAGASPAVITRGTPATRRTALRVTLGGVIGLVLAQLWFWSGLLASQGLLAHSDLYEYFLPVFLSPWTIWSPYEFAGFPAFADPQNASWYPLHVLFGLGGWWSGYIVAAYIVASLGAYAYVYQVTGHRMAAVAAGLAWPWCEALAEKFTHLQMLHAYAWLPVVLFSLERLTARPGIRWMAATAFSIGILILTGHPQAVVYCMYLCAAYGLLLGVTARNLALLAQFAGAFAAGVLIASVQIVPLFELSGVMSRIEVGFGQFADSYAKTPAELLTAVVPQIQHEGREAPTYVGALTLTAAIFAVGWHGSRWRLVFWVAVAAISLLLGLGSATPLATVAYHVPLYDRFRVLARHLALYSFAIVVLGSFGIAALTSGAWRMRTAGLVALATGAVVSLTFHFVASHPERFDIDESGGLLALASALGSGLAVQALVWVLTLVVVVCAARLRGRAISLALVAVLGIDLLVSQAEPVTVSGFQPPTVLPLGVVEPSLHTRWLKRLTDARFERLLPIAGSGVDAVAPGAFTRKWSVASAGGYGPIVLNRLARLAFMDANGSVRPRVLLAEDRSLDLLAVRYIIVRETDLADPSKIERAGLDWTESGLELAVGRPDCGYPERATLSFGLAAGSRVSEVALVSYLRCAEDVAQGETVGTITLVGRDGTRHSRPLRAGTEVADAHYGLRDVTPRIKHDLATVFAREEENGGFTATYLARFDFEPVVDAARIEIEGAPIAGWLMLDRLTVTDGSGSAPVALLQAGLRLTDRWREVGRVRTSRTTDRVREEEGRDEGTFLVLENTRALPRAWIVRQVRPTSDADALSALRTSVAPGAVPFDPVVTALVEPSATVSMDYPEGDARTTVTGVRDGLINISVTAAGGGFLVVSEMWYPGWTAEVDGRRVPVIRADYALMGVELPPGQHRVTFRFRPASLFLGATVSGITLVGLLVAVVLDPRRRPVTVEAGASRA